MRREREEDLWRQIQFSATVILTDRRGWRCTSGIPERRKRGRESPRMNVRGREGCRLPCPTFRMHVQIQIEMPHHACSPQACSQLPTIQRSFWISCCVNCLLGMLLQLRLNYLCDLFIYGALCQCNTTLSPFIWSGFLPSPARRYRSSPF